jgi:hypothetical protein
LTFEKIPFEALWAIPAFSELLWTDWVNLDRAYDDNSLSRDSGRIMERRGEGPIAPIVGLRRVRTLSFGFRIPVTVGGDGKDSIGESGAWPSMQSMFVDEAGAGW